MCELNGTEMDAATASNVRAIHVSHDNITSIFDAALKRADEKAERIHRAWLACQDDDDPTPPRKAA